MAGGDRVEITEDGKGILISHGVDVSLEALWREDGVLIDVEDDRERAYITLSFDEARRLAHWLLKAVWKHEDGNHP